MDIIDGRFKTIKKVYIGEIGETYIAEDMENGNRPVFVKILIKNRKIDNVLFNTFKAEASELKNIDFNNIPSFIASGEVDGEKKYYYVAYEYIEGRTLKELLDSIDDNFKNSVDKIVFDLLDIFDYLEKNNIVHRAIFPENIIITSENKVYLSNFGTLADKSNLKRELLPGEQKIGFTNKKSDQYSLGIILINLFALKYGFNKRIVNLKDLNEALKVLDEIPELKKILEKMINKDSTARFNKSGEIKEAIKKVLSGEKVDLNFHDKELDEETIAKEIVKKEYSYLKSTEIKNNKNKTLIKILVWSGFIYFWAIVFYYVLGATIKNMDKGGDFKRKVPGYTIKEYKYQKLKRMKTKIKLDTYKRKDLEKESK